MTLWSQAAGLQSAEQCPLKARAKQGQVSPRRTAPHCTCTVSDDVTTPFPASQRLDWMCYSGRQVSPNGPATNPMWLLFGSLGICHLLRLLRGKTWKWMKRTEMRKSTYHFSGKARPETDNGRLRMVDSTLEQPTWGLPHLSWRALKKRGSMMSYLVH